MGGINKNFKTELYQIESVVLRKLLIRVLNVVPEYFWEIPASSTGKHHPIFALGKGGLVRHTKACVKIATELFRNDTVQNFTQEEKDLIIVALILHDTMKNGVNNKGNTVTEHPLLVRKLFDWVDMSEDDRVFKDKVISLIETHMGSWNIDYKTKEEVLPKPSVKIQRFVHLCDYLASRKCLEVNFDA